MPYLLVFGFIACYESGSFSWLVFLLFLSSTRMETLAVYVPRQESWDYRRKVLWLLAGLEVVSDCHWSVVN